MGLMMHVRLNLLTADPKQLGDLLDYGQSKVRPALEGQPGSLGTSQYANDELGLAVFQSYWATERELRESEQSITNHREVLRRAAGTLTIERYQLTTSGREEPLNPGAGVRLTRLDVQPSAVPEVAEAFARSPASWLAETTGFRDVNLLADPQTGHCLFETRWRSGAELAASRSVAATVRADFARSAEATVWAVEEYRLVYSFGAQARRPAQRHPRVDAAANRANCPIHPPPRIGGSLMRPAGTDMSQR